MGSGIIGCEVIVGIKSSMPEMPAGGGGKGGGDDGGKLGGEGGHAADPPGVPHGGGEGGGGEGGGVEGGGDGGGGDGGGEGGGDGDGGGEGGGGEGGGEGGGADGEGGYRYAYNSVLVTTSGWGPGMPPLWARRAPTAYHHLCEFTLPSSRVLLLDVCSSSPPQYWVVYLTSTAS